MDASRVGSQYLPRNDRPPVRRSKIFKIRKGFNPDDPDFRWELMIHWSFTKIRLSPEGNPVAPYVHIDWFRSQKEAIKNARLIYVD